MLEIDFIYLHTCTHTHTHTHTHTQNYKELMNNCGYYPVYIAVFNNSDCGCMHTNTFTKAHTYTRKGTHTHIFVD